MPAIGETLREARMRRKLSVADVEEQTKIRAKYLRALENEEWGLLPGPTFVKTFLRTYAEVVGVDPYLLVEEYRTNHEPRDELDPPSRSGPPAVSRRPNRRRTPGPPGRGALVAGLVVALIAFLLVLGLVGGKDEQPGSQRAGTDSSKTAPKPAPRPKPKPRPKPPPSGVTVRLTPSVPTYVCLDSGEGTDVVFEGTLAGPRSFNDQKALRVNLGKRSVDMRVNGKPVTIEQSPEPAGFDLTPKGATEITDGTRPCA